MTSAANTHTLHLGAPLKEAHSAVILVHGRGSTASEISRLAGLLQAPAGTAWLAPEAPGNIWYPQRFLAPLEQNEPYLTQALATIDSLVEEVLAAGIPANRIGFAGFSQGACLVLEYAFRNARRYGFVAGLSGALIGPRSTPRASGDLQGTPVLVACAAQDAHIPLDHVEHSACLLGAVGGDVTREIFPGSAHTLYPAEIDWLNARLGNWKS